LAAMAARSLPVFVGQRKRPGTLWKPGLSWRLMKGANYRRSRTASPVEGRSSWAYCEGFGSLHVVAFMDLSPCTNAQMPLPNLGHEKRQFVVLLTMLLDPVKIRWVSRAMRSD